MKKEYEAPRIEATEIRDLTERLNLHAEDAKALYKEIQAANEALQTNLFNTQFVMDWQDCLNEVSITKKEDAEKRY